MNSPLIRSRTLLVGALAFLPVVAIAPAAMAQTSDDPHAASQARFERGTELFRRHTYPEALAEFQAAAEILRTPNILMAMGLCLARMGQASSAYNAFTEASALAVSLSDPRYGDTARRAEREATSLETHLARLDVHVDHPPADLSVRVEGEAAPSTNWNRPVSYFPGEVTVAASAPGFREFHQTVQLVEGQQVDVHVALEADIAPTPLPEILPVPVPMTAPPVETPSSETTDTATTIPAPGRALRTAGYVTGALGLAGFASFGIFGLMANSRFNSLQSACHMGPCPTMDTSQISTGQRWQTTADVSLAAGAGLLGVGVVLFVVGVTRHSSEVAPADAPPRLDAWVDPTHGSLGVRGAF